MHERFWNVLALLPILGAVACDGGGNDPEPPQVSYWQDVAPIFFESCVTCHQPDGIAPFRLDTYEEARDWASAARQAVEERTMPPWLVTADGSCGEFRDSRWLEDEQIATISAWVEAGTPEGTPRDDLLVPADSAPGEGLDDGSGEILDLPTPDFVPEPAGDEYAKFDEYRCFLLGDDAPSGFITGYEVVPGNGAIVHHALLMTVRPDLEVAEGVTNMDVMRALDEESPDRDGWPCYGLAGEGVQVDSVPVTWAPGMGPVPYPAKTGVPLAEGSVFVVQMHYNLADESARGQADSTTVRLRVAEEVERVGIFGLPDAFLDSAYEEEPDTLEPGKASVPYTWELELDQVLAAYGVDRIDVYGIFPHMHELGRRFRFELVNDDVAECGAEVARWDFNWQIFYFYEEPLTVTPGSRMRVTCEYDTRGLTEPTLPGWGTRNEMCLAGVYIVFP